MSCFRQYDFFKGFFQNESEERRLEVRPLHWKACPPPQDTTHPHLLARQALQVLCSLPEGQNLKDSVDSALKGGDAALLLALDASLDYLGLLDLQRRLKVGLVSRARGEGDNKRLSHALDDIARFCLGESRLHGTKGELREDFSGKQGPGNDTEFTPLSLDESRLLLFEARDALQESLALRRKDLGSDHHTELTATLDLLLACATALARLGGVARTRRRLDDARALYEESIRIRRGARNPAGLDSAETGFALVRLGGTLDAQGQSAQAAGACQEGLRILEREYGSGGQLEATVASYAVFGRAPDAAHVADKAPPPLEAHNDDQGVEVGWALADLAGCFRARGDLVQSRAYLEKSLKILWPDWAVAGDEPSPSPGPIAIKSDSLEMGDLMAAVADVYYALGVAATEKPANAPAGDAAPVPPPKPPVAEDFKSAVRCYKLSLSARARSPGCDELVIANTWTSLARALTAVGDVADVLNCWRRIVTIKGRRLGGDHVEVAEASERLADLLVAEGRGPEAHVCYQDALRIRRLHAPEGDPEVSRLQDKCSRASAMCAATPIPQADVKEAQTKPAGKGIAS
jgi:tetratricopeptide (TPR) repeat protein